MTVNQLDADYPFRFTHAIARTPAPSVVHGLRAFDVGAPDADRFREEHEFYIQTLEDCGLSVTLLPSLDAFPDSVFVEDTAICLPGLAVLLRPAAASRAGEPATIEPSLRTCYGAQLIELGNGNVDGGDILVTGREVMIGLSDRTDSSGAAALEETLQAHGFRTSVWRTPSDVLHFKSDCALLDAETVLTTERLDASGCFEGYHRIRVPAGEEAAANAVRVNEHVLLASGYPRTLEALTDAGYSCLPIEVREAAKLDGGLSCMSLRFSANTRASGRAL